MRNSDCEQVGELDEDETPSVESEGLRLPQTYDPNHTPTISPVASVSPEPSTLTETSKPDTFTEPNQSGKLQRVLADLKIATLHISEQLRRRLVQVIRKNLDAFAASPTDLGRTSVVIHTIKTGEARPFRHAP